MKMDLAPETKILKTSAKWICLYHHHVGLSPPMADDPTLILFPILVGMYVKLAKREERDVHEEFGKEWEEYASKTPRFVPHFGGIRGVREKGGVGR